MEKAPIVAINRHRINSDGYGIRTLVALGGCNLRCKYCINPSCQTTEQGNMMTTLQLYETLMQDDMYFLAAGGGVTFGGGEPLLWVDFISEFIEMYGSKIDIVIETCLNVPKYNIEKLIEKEHIQYTIDVKDLNRHIYERYTGKNILPLLENLELLVKKRRLGVGVKIKVPHIPNFNNEHDVKRTIEALGATFDDIAIVEVQYVTDADRIEDEHAFKIGKTICSTLKNIRKRIAEANNIPYEANECDSKGICPGTCEMCEQEYMYLRNSLIAKAEKNFYLDCSVNLYGIYKEPLPEDDTQQATNVYNVCHHLEGLVISREKEWEDILAKDHIKHENWAWLQEQRDRKEGKI